MSKLNYSSYANLFAKHMIKKDMTKISKMFFEFIIDEPNYIENEKGELYCWNSREAREWFRGEKNIYPNIREACAKSEIIEMAPDYLGDVFDDLLYENHQDIFYRELYDFIEQDDTIPEEIKTEFEADYDDSCFYDFASKAFLYAVTQENNQNYVSRSKKKITDKLSLEDLVVNIKKSMANLPKPVIIEVPEELDKEEMIYVEALLEAYSDKEHVTIATREELKKYKQLDENFSRQRKSYYAAESIRESVRDTFQEKDYKAFELFKKDVYDGVIDVVDDDYSNGYARLNKTLSQAVLVPISSILNILPGWITNEVRKGACHMLVNDGMIRWVKNYD